MASGACCKMPNKKSGTNAKVMSTRTEMPARRKSSNLGVSARNSWCFVARSGTRLRAYGIRSVCAIARTSLGAPNGKFDSVLGETTQLD